MRNYESYYKGVNKLTEHFRQDSFGELKMVTSKENGSIVEHISGLIETYLKNNRLTYRQMTSITPEGYLDGEG